MVAAINKGEVLPATETKTVTVVKPPPVEVKEVKKEPVVKETVPGPRTGSSSIPGGQLLPIYDGVYFRVQLSAMRRFRDANATFAQYRLSRPVLVEQHQGYYKYTAGSFPKYSQAQAFKNTAVSKGLSGSFIIAYQNGKRIDIMDALQATGGK
jgi:N-acetylmuramoyl-L-alanine amidase